MSMAVKPGYVNPLTMMGKKKTGLTPKENQEQKSEKKHDVQDLQAEKQTLQDHIMLLKSSTNGMDVSAESQEVLEKKLEEISNELRTAKSQEIQAVDLEPVRENFDRYEHADEKKESFGHYEIQQDKDEKYKILFSPYSEQ